MFMYLIIKAKDYDLSYDENTWLKTSYRISDGEVQVKHGKTGQLFRKYQNYIEAA